jgi:very-short-patch-repair endonuclease
VAATSRPDVEAALAGGAVVRVARGRYALPAADEARRAAHAHHAVAVGLSAAAHWGWLLKWQPKKPQLVVPRGRKVPAPAQEQYDFAWRPLPDTDVVDGWVTSRMRTVLDCAATLPFDEALAVADSALASGKVKQGELLARCSTWPVRTRARVRRVVEAADRRAANPFESVLRAIAQEVDGLDVVPQHRIDVGGRFVGRVDLADQRLRIVVEADSFEFHGEPELMARDCKRYDELVVGGWLVLRFSWNQVMVKPEWVRTILEQAVALRRRQIALSA